MALPPLGLDFEAARLHQLTIALDPRQPIYLYNVSILAEKNQGAIAAFKLLIRATSLAPTFSHAITNLAKTCGDLGLAETAIRFHSRALALTPNSGPKHYNLAVSEPQKTRSLFLYVNTLLLAPTLHQAHCNLANAAHDAGNSIIAERGQARSLAINPLYSVAYLNLGNNYKELGAFERADRAYRRGLLIEPGRPEIEHNYCMLLLLVGRFEEAWKYHDVRLGLSQVTQPDRQFPQPVWDGTPVDSGHVLLWAEQGVGDEVMFASLLRGASDRTQSFVLECDPRLLPLFQRSLGGITLLPRQVPPVPQTRHPAIKAQLATASLLPLVRPHPTPDDAVTAFLRPDPEKVAAYRKSYQERFPGKWLVGVSWKSTRNDQGFRKSTTLSMIAPKLQFPNMQLVSLQYGPIETETSAAKQDGFSIFVDETVDQFASLDDFAAQVAALDYVVSTSNTTVHIAGALGVPTTVVVPSVPEWRWQTAGRESLWYRSVTIERLAPGEDFSQAMERVAARVARRVLEAPWPAAWHALPEPASATDRQHKHGNASLLALPLLCEQLFKRSKQSLLEGEARTSETLSSLILALLPNAKGVFPLMLAAVEKQGHLDRGLVIIRQANRLDLVDANMAHNGLLFARRQGDWHCAERLCEHSLVESNVNGGASAKVVDFVARETDLLRLSIRFLAEAAGDTWESQKKFASLLELLALASLSLQSESGERIACLFSAIDPSRAHDRLKLGVRPLGLPVPGTDPFRLAISVAMALSRVGRPTQAATLLARVAAHLPNFDQALLGLAELAIHGHAQREAGKLALRYLAVAPRSPRAWFLWGRTADELPAGHRLRALCVSVALEPANAVSRRQAGAYARDACSPDLEGRLLAPVLALSPDSGPDFVWLAGRFNRADAFLQARRASRRALALSPDHPRALYQLGCALYHGGESVLAAAAALVRSCAIEPFSAPSVAHFATVVGKITEPLEPAARFYRLSIALDPANGEPYSNLGSLVRDRIGARESLAYHDRAHQLLPNRHDVRLNKSLARLMIGDFETGWELYDSRLQAAEVPVAVREHPQRRWTGEPIDGRLLIWSEQGLGDQIMFASILKDVAPLVSGIVLEVEPRLQPLFSRSFHDVEVVGRVDPPEPATRMPDVEAQIPAGSLARLFRSSRADFAEGDPFLTADPERVAHYRSELRAQYGGRKLLGVAWRSFNSGQSSAKSMDVSTLAELSEDRSVLFTLQYGSVEKDLATFERVAGVALEKPPGLNVTDDIDGLAAFIGALDAVVSTSNTTVHLAGALGVPVYLLLQKNADWRWQDRGDDALWYRSVRIVRQPRLNDWRSTVAQVKKLLYPA